MAVTVQLGNAPLLLTQPHGGTWIPEALRADYNETGLELADTDWWQRELWEGLSDDVTRVSTDVSRYVIDCNRPPDGSELYASHPTTSLCPLTDFEGQPIYRAGREPDAAEIARRRREFHQRYHDAIAEQVRRLRWQHETILLLDGHSIRSELPFLFEGRLPSFNWGTAHGTTCAPDLAALSFERSAQWLGADEVVLDGRFVGGWTVRHHGRPDRGVHALQLEMAQSVYLIAERAPWARDVRRWRRLRRQLRELLTELLAVLPRLPRCPVEDLPPPATEEMP